MNDIDNTIEDTLDPLSKLELIIDKAAALRLPHQQSEVRLIGEPDDVANLLLGLARARPNFGPIGKPATGQMGNKPYQYAPLPELVKATAGPLAAESLVVLQFLTGAPGEDHRLTTWVTNGRARIESVLVFAGMPLEDSGQVKSWGALTTYLRRYTYQAILQLDGDADADSPAGDQAGKRHPPPLEAAPALQRRSEPPPKPAQRPPAKPPQKPAQAPQQTKPDGFASRLAANRGSPAPEPPPDMPPLWGDDEQPYVPARAIDPDTVVDALVHGDRPTAPIIEPPKAKAPGTVPPEKAERFLKLAKQLGLTGPKLLTWMEARINKTDPSKVTEAEVDFLTESALEELAAQ